MHAFFCRSCRTATSLRCRALWPPPGFAVAAEHTAWRQTLRQQLLVCQRRPHKHATSCCSCSQYVLSKCVGFWPVVRCRRRQLCWLSNRCVFRALGASCWCRLPLLLHVLPVAAVCCRRGLASHSRAWLSAPSFTPATQCTREPGLGEPGLVVWSSLDQRHALPHAASFVFGWPMNSRAQATPASTS